MSSTTSNCLYLQAIYDRVFHYVRLIDVVRLLDILEYQKPHPSVQLYHYYNHNDIISRAFKSTEIECAIIMRFNVENTVCISGKVAEVGAKNNRWSSFSTIRYYTALS